MLIPVRRWIRHDRRILLRRRRIGFRIGLRRRVDDGLHHDQLGRKRPTVRQRKRPLREEARSRRRHVRRQNDAAGERQSERVDVDFDFVARPAELRQVVGVRRILQGNGFQPG